MVSAGLALLLLINRTYAQTAVWQWSVPVRNAANNNGLARVYLWIPEHCKQLRGFIFAQHNMEEQSILENPGFRKAMSDLDFAEVWVAPAYDLFFNYSTGAGDVFNNLMHDLAEASGYAGLTQAPFIGMGHSAAASAPYYMAVWNPKRALAAISVSGQWPYFRGKPFAPDIWGDANLDHIPCLETMGEYEAAATWSAEGLRERKAHPLLPLSMLACPGRGHFASSQEKIDFIAFYIKKVVQYRLPKNTPAGAAPLLLPVNPQQTGWLADKWRDNQPPAPPAAPVAQYKGNPDDAFWFFDMETADSALAIEARYRNLKPQLVGYLQHGVLVGQKNTHQQINLRFEPLADGITFKVKCAFYDTVPGGSPRLANWTGLPVGTHIGHASGRANIAVDIVAGPMVKLDDSTFRVQPRAGYCTSSKGAYEMWFAATQPGDAEYKPAVQQAQMLVPPVNKSGRAQHIAFKPIANQRQGATGIIPVATADSGELVGFYIQDGPARIVNGRIDLTPVPPGSKFPVKVTVVAWQYGRAAPPQLQSAEPVERVFWINK